MFRRVRHESGMTLPEVLVAMSIGMIITLAAFGLVSTAMTQSGEAAARIEAVQRGRSAMDTVTRQLRSQACVTSNVLPGTLPRAIETGTPEAVVFYADMRDISNKAVAPPAPPAGFVAGPERRSLTFEKMDPADPKTNWKLIERRWRPREPAGATYTYADPPIVREVLTDVERDKKGGVEVPFFQYFAYDFDLAVPLPNKRIPEPPNTANPLAIAEAQSVAKITITYRAQPTQERPDNRASVVFDTDIFVRTVDPNAETSELKTPCL
jgi:type II secretory pathway pseudopilin PulG